MTHLGGRRKVQVVVGVLLVAVIFTASGYGTQRPAPDAPGSALGRAQAVIAHALDTNGSYRGPLRGPPAQPPALVVFVAADLTNGGVAGVARGAEEAARAIGWKLRVLDGQGTVAGQGTALAAALSLRPAGIILGGFDAASQQAELQQAKAQGIPVVGWHSGIEPGPDPQLGLFTNVTTDPYQVALLAASYVIANSHGTAGVIVFTDSQYSIAIYKSDVMVSIIKSCRRCSVLKVVDYPLAGAQINVAAPVTALLDTFGKRFTYLLAINGNYIAGARVALLGAGRQPNQPPYEVAAGDGDASEFARIRAGDYQKATVAEPLNLQGWQLIDELNRARAGQPPSGYLAPPHLVTQANVPSGGVFDPQSGYRKNYLRIWHP